MPTELGNLISRLKHIEEKLIHEEQVLTGIRCEVKDSILIATDLWEKNAQAEMNAAAIRPPEVGGGTRRQSLAQRFTQNLKTFTHKLETKDSKTQKSVRTVPVTDEDESLPSVPLTQASRTADTRQDDSRQYDFFQSQGTFSKFLRSDFFKKPYHLRAGLAANVSRSQLELNDFDAHISTYFIIHPESTFKKCWDVFEYIITVLQFFLLPLFLGFVELSIGLNYLTIVTTIVYTLSIFITLRTGIYKQYVLIMDRSKIEAEYYNSGRFLYDVITAFPFVFVVDALAKDPQSNIAWRLLCFLNATRALRIAFGPESFWFPYVIKKIRLKYKINGATVGIVKVLGFMFIYWHWSACINNLVDEIEEDASLAKYSMGDRYTLKFYHSAAEMLAAGFGTKPPDTMLHRWLTIVNFILSATIVAVLVGNVSSFMIGLDSSGRIFQEKMDEVSQYITYKELDWNLRTRILEYYQYKYDGGKYFDEKKIMTELNSPLRQSILMHNCKNLILKVPFFRDGDNSFISQVVLALEVNHFLPQDTVIEIGSSGDEMYFIASGICEVISGGVVRARLTSGSFFGEISLLFGRMKRTATIKSVTPCVLYSLSKTQLDEVLSHHPNMAHAIRKVAEERLAQQQAQEKPPTNTDSSSSLDQVNEEEKEEQEFNLMEHQSDKKSDNGSEREQS